MSNTYIKMQIEGLVQGIGFRPFIAETAQKFNIYGTVENSGGIVTVYAYLEDISKDFFADQIKKNVPKGGLINKIIIDDITKDIYIKKIESHMNDIETIKAFGMDNYHSFYIIKSSSNKDVIRLLPPDISICNDCERDLLDKDNRRYKYPFISCVSCGPRYTIMKSVPYDRASTTMDKFKMCPSCYAEYTKRHDIRRHAQTISCHECGPKLKFVKIGADDKDTLYKNDALDKAIECINNEEIGAVLDIGGFHFVFSAFCTKASRKLRKWKNREAKPFAIMFESIEQIRKYCYVNKKEEILLKSLERPIVLLRRKENVKNDIDSNVLANSDMIGAMLPCSGLQILLVRACGPLVMTSGNRGGEPIVANPDDMMTYLSKDGISFMLSHDRDVLNPLDDSIYQLSLDGSTQIIRRARGLVPWPVDLPLELESNYFAAGGDLKSVFAFAKKDKVYLSGHFGDLDDMMARKKRLESIKHIRNMFLMSPKKLVSDKHPLYYSTKELEDVCFLDKNVNLNAENTVVCKAQHHLAHVASVIAEKKLSGNIIGIAFDGTGYGDDKSIWGSEFFLCSADNSNKEFKYKHAASLSKIKMIGSDAGAKDAVKSLYAYLHKTSGNELDANKINDVLDMIGASKSDYKIIEAAIDNNINVSISSSMGRLFDAVSALLGICSYNSYEGECATKLEMAAFRYLKAQVEDYNFAQNTSRHNKDAMLESSHENIVEMENGICNTVNFSNQIDVENSNIENLYSEVLMNTLKSKLAEYDREDTFNFIKVSDDNFFEIDSARIISILAKGKLNGKNSDYLAFLFHMMIVISTKNMVNKLKSVYNGCGEKVVISGGTFFNKILTSGIRYELFLQNIECFGNELVPSGDGGLALGQIYLGAMNVTDI